MNSAVLMCYHYGMNFLRNLKDHFVPSEGNVYRPHILRKPWLIFFLTVILTSEGVFIADLVGRQSAFNFVAAVLPGEVIALTNGERSANNLGTLTQNTALTAAAQAKADDMALNGYFSHVGPDGKEPWAWVKAAGYNYQYAGENLAVRFNDSSEVVNAWMASPTHRANIVKPQYTEIGVGVAQGQFRGESATYVVQYFGAPRQTTAALPAAPVTSATKTATASTTPTPVSPQVAGAETAAAPVPTAHPTSVTPQPTPSPFNSFARSLLSSDSHTNEVTLWLLGAVAALMVVGLALTFFVHIQIQPTDMLISGTVIAVIAIGFLMLNLQTVGAPTTTQSAAVFGALPTSGGFIDAQAIAVQE